MDYRWKYQVNRQKINKILANNNKPKWFLPNDFYLTFKEKEYQLSSNYSRELKRKEYLPSSFCEAYMTMIPHNAKTMIREKNCSIGLY